MSRAKGNAVVEFLLLAGFAGICLLVAWVMFWILPISLNAESKCFAKGYPVALVDWKGNAYCTTLDGAVTVKVEAVK